MTREWFTISELAGLNLPDLPPSERQLARAAKAWDAHSRKRAGRGGGLEYHIDALPAAARLKLQIVAAQQEKAERAKSPIREALWARYNALPETHKTMCEGRLKALLEALEMEAAGLSQTAAMQLAADRHDVSLATIYNWFGMVANIERADWLPALAPNFAATSKRADCHPDAWDFLKSDYLRNSKSGFSSCYRRMQEAAKKKNWAPIPEERSLRRRFKAEVPETVVILARNGEEKAKKLFPAQRRTRTHLHAMQAVNMDGHKLDVFVRVPWADQPVRLYLIGIQDLYSGKVLAWRLTDAETWEAVRLVIGDMVEQFGIPDKIFLDNGRAFASKWITGGTRTRFRFKVREEDPRGLLTTLGVEIIWTKPYSGQSKPIERAWRDLAEEISKHPYCDGAYTGNNPMAKPENYGNAAVPLNGFRDHVAREIARHNARTGRKAVACKGRSFDETFAASMEDLSWVVRWPTEGQKSLWLLASDVVRAQRGSGEIHFQGNRYWNVALNAHAGQKVTLRFDPDKLHQPIQVYDLKNRLICEAACIEDAGFDNRDAARNHERLRRDHIKAVKAATETHKKLNAQELADILARGEKATGPEPLRPAVTRLATGNLAAAIEHEPNPAEPGEQIDFTETFGRALRLISGGLDD